MEMKVAKYLLLPLLILPFAACEDLVDGINDNPNKVTIDDVDAPLFLTGAQLANASNQLGHIQRIAASWSGQLIGFQSLYKALYEYNLTSAETNDIWEQSYQGVVTQVRHIRNQLPEDRLFQGISKVIEAHSIGTLAAIFGDIPYTEIIDEEIDDPAFDDQIAVFGMLQDLLDEAIDDLNAANSRPIAEDIYYNGDKEKWLEAAWTLKARYFTITKQYDQAFAAAQNGISAAENGMYFKPLDSPNRDDKNLFNTLLSGSRAGDIGNEGTFLLDLLDEGGDVSRNHSKTNEAARYDYLFIDESSDQANQGVAGPLEPMPLVIYAENLLTLAEAGARTEGFATGLQYLNEWRAYLNSGSAFKILDPSAGLEYAPFADADFQPGGIENPDGIDPVRALLREVVEERYVSLFMQFLPFHDARRLRNGDQDIAVDIPFNTPTTSLYPERFIYPQDELNANPNAQEPAEGLYFVLPVNR